MPHKSTKVVAFKSEAEEADWYATPEGRRQTEREFSRALRTGSINRSGGPRVAKTNPKLLEHLMEQAKQNATRAISIRIPITDLERAKQIAQKAGVGYQTVLKKAIREGLKRAG
jgi:hypothetical protein